MSNTSKKRTEMMISEDRARVCKLLAMGYRSKTEIANIINEGREPEFKISAQQISYDIEWMKNKYLETGIEDYKVYRNQMIDEINLLKRTFYQGYELSRRNKITLESEAVVDEDEYEVLASEGTGLNIGEKVFDRQAKVREEQRLEGNVAYLQGVLSCIDREAKIYGVDAPNKYALTDATGNKDAVDILDFMKQKVNELAVKTEERRENEPLLLNE